MGDARLVPGRVTTWIKAISVTSSERDWSHFRRNHPLLDWHEAGKSDESSKTWQLVLWNLRGFNENFSSVRHQAWSIPNKKIYIHLLQSKGPSFTPFLTNKTRKPHRCPAVAEAFLAERTSELINKSSMVQDRWEYTFSNKGILAGNVSGWFSSQPAVHVVSLSGKNSFLVCYLN